MSTTPRTRVRRKPDRASYDRDVIDAILDEALYCHVGLVRDGVPIVIPTIHARRGDALYLHGSNAAGVVRDMTDGRTVCVAVSLLDGLVLARSANHHSMNYRSVVVYGSPRLVDEPSEFLSSLEAIVEHVVPGRWATLRDPTEAELRETSVLAVPLDEASAKIRTGGPIDPAEDLGLPTWAGVLPVRLVPGDPIPSEDLRPGIEVPAEVAKWQR